MPTLIDYRLGEGVRAFSTTRIPPGQLSAAEVEAMGNYAAFNLTHYCGDDPQRVKRNREWLCRKLLIDNSRLLLPRQTHTNHVRNIDAPFLTLNAEQQQAELEATDALITDVEGICIGISTADCVPILLFDPTHRAIAAIHAGWRGTIGRIAQHALHQMNRHYGTRPAEIQAVIGPSISENAFEVGEEVATMFRQADFPDSIITQRPAIAAPPATKPHIDLWAANTWLLETEGVPLHHIQISGICTYAQHDTFFSARRLGIHSGRIFTGIMLSNP